MAETVRGLLQEELDPTPDAMNEQAKEATEKTRELTDDQIRERILQLGFGGDRTRLDAFVSALQEALPDDVSVVVRGSAVIGVRWEDGSPFDADGPGTSDLDLTLVGGDMLKLWSDDAFYIPKLHTAPLNDDTPQSCPSLVPLRRALCKIAGRPVNIQATSSIVQYARDVLFDQPYFTLIDASKKDETDATDATDAAGRQQPAYVATDRSAPSSVSDRRRDATEDARA